MAKLPSFSSQTSSLVSKEGPSPEEQAAAERRRQRRAKWRARLAANRPFVVAAVEVTKDGFTQTRDDDDASAVTCGASVGRLNVFVGLEVLVRVAPIITELQDLAVSLGMLSGPGNEAPGSNSNGLQPGATTGQMEAGNANLGRGQGKQPADSVSRGQEEGKSYEDHQSNAAADALSSTAASVFTALAPSICAAVPSIRLDISAVVDAPRLIVTGRPGPKAESPTSDFERSSGQSVFNQRSKTGAQNAAIVVDAGQLELSVWPISSAVHQQERRRRASQQDSSGGRTPTEQGLLAGGQKALRGSNQEKNADEVHPDEGVWAMKALEIEAWDRHPSLPRDVVGGRYSQRFRVWNSARVGLAGASVAVADVSVRQLASREGLLEGFGDESTWVVEPMGAEVSVTLLKEVGSSLFGGGAAASVAVGLKVLDVVVDPLPDRLARAAQVGTQLMQGVTDMMAEVSAGIGTPGKRVVTPEPVGLKMGRLPEVGQGQVVSTLPEGHDSVPSVAKANQVELFSLACYIHAAKTKARLSETKANQAAEEGLQRGLDANQGAASRASEDSVQRSSGLRDVKSKAHGRWVKATRTITRLQKEAGEDRGQRNPRAEQSKSLALQRLEGVSADVALEGAWLIVHLSGRECQADLAGGLGALRMMVQPKPENESWGASSLILGPASKLNCGGELTISRCGFEVSLGEILRRAGDAPGSDGLPSRSDDRETAFLEGGATTSAFGNDGASFGDLPQASLISAALQVGSLTFLESGEAGPVITRHVKQVMTGSESLTLAVEVSGGLQAVSVSSMGGLLLVDSGALAQAYAFLTDFATVLVASVSTGMSVENSDSDRPQVKNIGSGVLEELPDSPQAVLDAVEASEEDASALFKAGAKRSLKEGAIGEELREGDDEVKALGRGQMDRPMQSSGIGRDGKKVKWADESRTEGPSQESGLATSKGVGLLGGPVPKEGAAEESNRQAASGRALESGLPSTEPVREESAAALLEIKVLVSMKGLTLGLLRSTSVDPGGLQFLTYLIGRFQ
jgi:hypothetical protein